MTIYEITEEYQQLLALMEDPDVDPEILSDTMEGIEGEFEAKAEGYAVVRNQLIAKVTQITKEIERLDKWSDSLNSNIKRIDNALIDSMQLMGIKKVQTEHFRIGVVGNGGKKPLKLIGKVPEEYYCMKPEIDTKRIRADLESGIALGFAHLEERGKHLSIR